MLFTWAAMNGHKEGVEILQERGTLDFNCQDQHDEVPLGWAVIYGYENVVKLMLQREDVNIQSPRSEKANTALVCCS